jgi:hypothetical protein
MFMQLKEDVVPKTTGAFCFKVMQVRRECSSSSGCDRQQQQQQQHWVEPKEDVVPRTIGVVQL